MRIIVNGSYLQHASFYEVKNKTDKAMSMLNTSNFYKLEEELISTKKRSRLTGYPRPKREVYALMRECVDTEAQLSGTKLTPKTSEGRRIYAELGG